MGQGKVPGQREGETLVNFRMMIMISISPLQVSSYLAQLKMSLTGLTFLPTGDEASTKEAAVCRDTLEIGAQHAVSLGDTKMFERYMAQLLTYYYDYNNALPDSAFKYQLLGLNLLCLLSQNRVSEFHTELER